MVLQTWLTKPYKYNGLMAHGLPNITYILFFEHMVYQTLQILWFEGARLTKLCVYNGLGTHGSPNITPTSI